MKWHDGRMHRVLTGRVFLHAHGQKLENKQEKGNCLLAFPKDLMPPTLWAPETFLIPSYTLNCQKSMFSANLKNTVIFGGNGPRWPKGTHKSAPQVVRHACPSFMKVLAYQAKAIGISGLLPQQMPAFQMQEQVCTLEPNGKQHPTFPSHQITKSQATARNDNKAINSWI